MIKKKYVLVGDTEGLTWLIEKNGQRNERKN